MTNNKLKDLLLRAFTVGDPPQELLAGHPLDYEEEKRMTSPFLGKRWTELELGYLNEWETEFVGIYFTPRAFQYYLPGLLLSFLDESARESNALLFDNFIWSVLSIQLPVSEDDRQYETKMHLVNLNSLQKYVIALWVEDMRRVAEHFLSEESWVTLKMYWGQYLTTSGQTNAI